MTSIITSHGYKFKSNQLKQHKGPKNGFLRKTTVSTVLAE